MFKTVQLVLIGAMLLLFGTRAEAVEVLSSQELYSHCEVLPEDSESVDGQYCIRYIQGFIDGAVTTDIRVMMNIEAEAESERSSTLAERAMRTRLPSRDDSERAAKYAEFCLGDPVPLAEVVDKVVIDLESSVKAGKAPPAARDSVYNSLRKHYPCLED